jgi:spore germination cell wall hydrolase CwlJ-like protein
MEWIPDDLIILARTIYGEARGQSWQSLIAIGHVINNRALQSPRFGRCIEAVCQQPYAFACWNPHDPRREAITEATPASPSFRECLAAAAAVLCGLEPDNTGAATHYHALGQRPTWAQGAQHTCIIGQHVFYTGMR